MYIYYIYIYFFFFVSRILMWTKVGELSLDGVTAEGKMRVTGRW